MSKPYEPRAYQPLMSQHILATQRCAIWSFMGSGKTCAVMSALRTLDQVEDIYPVLVLATKRVARGVWTREAAKWDHLDGIRVVPVLGTADERRRALLAKAEYHAINYDNLPWLMENLPYNGRWPYRTVVADESTRLKSYRIKQGGARAHALGQVTHSHVRRFIELTGTPSPNGLKDLWGQLWFLDGGERLGASFDAFQQRWFQQSRDGYGLTPLPHAQAEIQERVADLAMSLNVKDWFDIDDPIVTDIYVDLPPPARVLYRKMEREMFLQIEQHAVEAFNAASRTIKCLQLANGAIYVDEALNWKEVHDEKIEALRSIIEDAAGAPVLVAYQFKSDLARLKRAFLQGRVFDDKQSTEDQWNRGEIPIMFVHPASAGHGIDLQDGGNIIVFFGHWWNLEEYQQIIERIGGVRQLQSGHLRPVYIYHIIARRTVDEMVMDRRASKRSVQEILMEYCKAQR